MGGTMMTSHTYNSFSCSETGSFFDAALVYELNKRKAWWKTYYLMYLSISIYGIYIAPFQGNFSEALPAQARAKRKVLRRL